MPVSVKITPGGKEFSAGAGGIGHWAGSPGMGRVELDLKILEMPKNGDIEGLLALPDAMVEAEGGNGCLEIKNWTRALGALPGAKADAVVYEAMPEWITGVGFAELKWAA